MHRPSILALASLAALSWGCGKTVAEEDCKKISDHMREVWSAEVKKAAPPEGVGAKRAASILAQEGEKLTNDWSAECKKELLGRRVDPKEMDCLLGAPSVEQMTKCAEL